MTVSCTQGRDVGSECTFACTAEAELTGPQEVSCVKNVAGTAEWDDKFPTCQRLYKQKICYIYY